MTDPKPPEEIVPACEECNDKGFTIGKCCPEPKPCAYRGAQIPCLSCGPWEAALEAKGVSR